VDLADVSAWSEVRGAVDTLRWFSPSELRAAQRRAPGRAGRGVVTRLPSASSWSSTGARTISAAA